MNVLDTLWHLLNFMAPATCIGLSSALLAKLVWRAALRSVSWTTLVLWAALPALAAALLGLVLTGRDGKMLVYGAMVLASAVGLWTRIPSRP